MSEHLKTLLDLAERSFRLNMSLGLQIICWKKVEALALTEDNIYAWERASFVLELLQKCETCA